MQLRENRDLIGGSILALGGLVFTLYTALNYDLGTPGRMGPGMFPAALGVLLCLIGIAMAGVAISQREPFPEIRIRVPFFVLASIAAFTVVLGLFGLLPAIVAVVAVSSFAERKVDLRTVTALCVALCLMSWLIFGLGLRLPVTMLRVPF